MDIIIGAILFFGGIGALMAFLLPALSILAGIGLYLIGAYKININLYKTDVSGDGAIAALFGYYLPGIVFLLGWGIALIIKMSKGV